MSDAPVVRPSLLPPNATKRELAIEGADAAIGDLDVGQIVTARDPATTPAAYLADLAWERSVWVWDPTWPDAVKRAVIEAAPEVHRHIGSVYAVKTALATLNVDARITEWWQKTPRGVPYAFDVVALARPGLYPGAAPALDARLVKVVFGSVLRTKPLSRAFDLVVAADMPATLGLAPVVGARGRVATTMIARSRRTVAATLGLASVAIARSRTATLMQPANGRVLTTTLGLAPVVLGRVRVAAAMTL